VYFCFLRFHATKSTGDDGWGGEQLATCGVLPFAAIVGHGQGREHPREQGAYYHDLAPRRGVARQSGMASHWRWGG